MSHLNNTLFCVKSSRRSSKVYWGSEWIFYGLVIFPCNLSFAPKSLYFFNQPIVSKYLPLLLSLLLITFASFRITILQSFKFILSKSASAPIPLNKYSSLRPSSLLVLPHDPCKVSLFFYYYSLLLHNFSFNYNLISS